MKIPSTIPLLLLTCAPLSYGALTNYWPFNETTGSEAVSAASGGTNAALFPGATFVNDPIRGQVLNLDGIDGYATAGVLPILELNTKFTWAFWANSNMTANNNIMIGNRYPNTGWVKFTTAAFEFRDLTPTFNETIDYPDFPVNTWIHHAVVKNGQLFTYYRNGVATGNTWNTGVLPANTPMYFGGDTTNENWGGRLDDVATWTDALSTDTIAGLFGAKYTPLSAPLVDTPPGLAEIFSEDFSGDLFTRWNETSRGLENNAEAGYDFAAITGGAVVLGGTATAQHWYGRSLETQELFDARKYTEVSVKRTSLTGSGTAYRSSIWIFGDATHYLHLSQNIGEGGWSVNCQDAGGSGTLEPTGRGFNLDGLDDRDSSPGSHQIKIRVLPTGITGGVNIEVQVDGVAYVVRGFTNFPQNFRVILTGQARATGDNVSAVFDDVKVSQPVIISTPPSFQLTEYLLPTATVGTAYSYDLATSQAAAFDPENDTLTYTKVSGPTWLNVAANGQLSGTPDAGLTTAKVLIRASDPNGGEATTTLLFRINNPSAATPPLFGWWPLNETAGNFGADISGGGNRANITNAATGGLAADGSVWVSDVDYGPVISFNGLDGPSAGWAVVGSPPTTGTLPVMDLPKTFTWSFWAKPTSGANNDIILGNRYNNGGGEFGPVQFTKFTGSSFEWYRENNQPINYMDLNIDAWAHHVIVKDGPAIFYYRDGELQDGRSITHHLNHNMPIFFGGGTNGVEAWSGYLHDVRLFNGALSETAVEAVNAGRGQFTAVSPTFTASLYYQPAASAGVPYSRSVAALASDPQPADALTFSKVSGPAWAEVSAAGVISGTPDTAPAIANVVVRVQDPGGNAATASFQFRVEDPGAVSPTAYGIWPLDDGSGITARDTSGHDIPVNLFNSETGGLSDTAGSWLSDPERGTVLSFNGDVTTGAYGVVGTPPGTGALPTMDLSNSFTWAFWAKPDQTGNNDIILGNRFNETGVEFVPQQFIKFTSAAFEWSVNGVAQGIDYPDIAQGVWAHHAVVKEGPLLFYYRNGELLGLRTLTSAPTAALPIFLGGGTNATETWRGSLSDVRLLQGSTSEAALAAMAIPPSNGSLVFTSVSLAPNRTVTLQWNGEAGKTYTVLASKTTSGFVEIGESTTTSFTFPAGHPVFNTAVETKLFFRVAEKPAN